MIVCKESSAIFAEEGYVKGPYFCTKEKGHDGKHTAKLADGTVVKEWE
jgi:hypothetical protein